MHNYTDVDVFPTNIQLIDDSDSPNATNFGTTDEGLANRTRWLFNRTVKLVSRTFTNSTAAESFTPPMNALPFAWVEGYGGGGGGAGGGGGDNGTNEFACGGGGGGGALLSTRIVPITAGVPLTVTVGAGGADCFPNTDGNDGVDSTIAITAGPVVIARFPGGQGGITGSASSGSSKGWGPGGAPIRGSGLAHNPPRPRGIIAADVADHYNDDTPSHGGAGTTNNVGNNRNHFGNPSPQGFAGGDIYAGQPSFDGFGPDDGTYRGGGSGGGGGAGPAGKGGQGGAGGVASAIPTADPGAPGNFFFTPVANTGAGGGGGGGGGACPIGGDEGAGGAGGKGASGKIVITYALYGALT